MKALFFTDRSLVESVRPVLAEEGVRIEAVEPALDPDFKAKTRDCDAVVLDRDHCGDRVYTLLLRWYRAVPRTHVLVLLPRGCDSAATIEAFDAGADAYLLNPFCVEELRARFRALGRRGTPDASSVLRTHDLEIDTVNGDVRRAGQPIHLTRREFDLLSLLANHQGRIVSRSKILETVFDKERDDYSNVIDVYIRYLRGKIDKGFKTPLILTSWGRGYRLRAQDA